MMMLFAAFLSPAHAFDLHLYGGLAAPIQGGGVGSTGWVAVFDAAPAALELTSGRWGVRLAPELTLSVSQGGWQYNGGSARVELLRYFAARPRPGGMTGFYLGPTAGFAWSEVPGAPLAPLAGVSVGYSGRLGDHLVWRTGGWAAVSDSPQGLRPRFGITAFEVGGFFF